VDLDDLAELFGDDDDLPVRFYCLEPKEGTLEELVTLALSAEVGGANMACRPRLNEPEIKANVRHFEDPDETCRPLSRLCDVLREDAANTPTLQK